MMTAPLPVVGVSAGLGLAIGTTLMYAVRRVPLLATSPGGTLPVRSRLPLVAVGTGVLFAAVTMRFGVSAELPAYLYLAALGLTYAMLDLEVRRLADPVILPSYIVTVLLLLPAGAGEAGWWGAARAVAGMVALLALFLALALAYPNGVGMSDVKLAGLVGMYLGWLSWNALFLTAVGSILIAAVIGSFAIVTKHATPNMAVRIAPCLVGAAILALFVSTPISSWYASLITT